MPLYPGGTLQTHLDERAVGGAGLGLSEVRWIAAQITIALGEVRFILHSWVKPGTALAGTSLLAQ